MNKRRRPPIKDVIRQTILAIYKDKDKSKDIYLKGGLALILGYGLENRLSTDADFSLPRSIEESEDMFEYFEKTIKETFHEDGYEAYDFTVNKKPDKEHGNKLERWTGWEFNFKLIDHGHNYEGVKKSSKGIMFPGAATNKIEIDLSEHEHCEPSITKNIDGVDVNLYSAPLIILEKIRALCQQHPDYKLINEKRKKNRARDLYDISVVMDMYIGLEGYENLVNQGKEHLDLVFESKYVSLEIIDHLYTDKKYITFLEKGWNGFKQGVDIDLEPFDYYLERIKDLLTQIQDSDGRGERI